MLFFPVTRTIHCLSKHVGRTMHGGNVVTDTIQFIHVEYNETVLII
jgi:hypothetical protein